MNLPVGAKPVCPIVRLAQDLVSADTGTKPQHTPALELEEPSKADNVLTEQADKMRESRLHMVATLEAYVDRSEISIQDAVSFFANATLLHDSAVCAYFSAFATRGSRLQLYASELVVRAAKGGQRA